MRDQKKSKPWPNVITRRDFLNGMLASSALTLMPTRGNGGVSRPAVRAMDATDSFKLCHAFLDDGHPQQAAADGRVYDCIIIGGGMAGLVVAWNLQRDGMRDLMVLEQNGELGGLCRSDSIGNVTFARASAYASFPFNREMADLYLDLGLVTNGPRLDRITGVPEFQLKRPYDQVFVNGQWVSDPFDKSGIARLPVSTKIRDELSALTAQLQKLWDWEDPQGRSAFDCPLEASSPSRKMRDLDSLTLGQYAESQGWSLEMVRLLDPLLRSAYGVGHDRISAWAALDLLSDEMLPADPGRGSLCQPGGNAFLAGKISERIRPETITTGAFVTRVQQRDDEVHVGVLRKGSAMTLRARTVVFAAPLFMAPHLIRELPAERTKAAGALEYAPYLVANLAVSRTPRDLAYSNQLVGNFFVSDFIVADWAGLTSPTAAPLNRPNVLTAYCPLSSAQREGLLEAPIDDWQAKIMADFEKCLPGIGETVTGFHLYRWGHAFSVPRKGWLFSPERQLLRQRLGRIAFAGADVEGIPTIDHAMASGFRAAKEVRKLLG